MIKLKLPVIALLACALAGCQPQPLGEKAPAFGSSAQYATVPGFLTGHWKRAEESPAGMKGITTADLFGDFFLEFKPDHTCEFRHNNQIVHMQWKESGKAVVLTAVDVQGHPAKQVQADFNRLMQSTPSTTITKEEARAMQYGFLLQMASFSSRLELMDDKKRLREAAADGQNQSALGAGTWLRLDR